MKFELREGTYVIMPKNVLHRMTDVYAMGRNERYGISLECISQDYYDDNDFVQNLRSRSLNHNNIVRTLNDLDKNRLKYYKSLDCKRRRGSYPCTLKTQSSRR